MCASKEHISLKIGLRQVFENSLGSLDVFFFDPTVAHKMRKGGGWRVFHPMDLRQDPGGETVHVYNRCEAGEFLVPFEMLVSFWSEMTSKNIER